MGRTGSKPRVVFTEVAKQLSKRLGISEDEAKSAINALGDIIKEALYSQVDVVLGDLGIFSLKHSQTRYFKTCAHGKEEIILVKGFDYPMFRIFPAWKREMRKNTESKYLNEEPKMGATEDIEEEEE